MTSSAILCCVTENPGLLLNLIHSITATIGSTRRAEVDDTKDHAMIATCFVQTHALEFWTVSPEKDMLSSGRIERSEFSEWDVDPAHLPLKIGVAVQMLRNALLSTLTTGALQIAFTITAEPNGYIVFTLRGVSDDLRCEACVPLVEPPVHFLPFVEIHPSSPSIVIKANLLRDAVRDICKDDKSGSLVQINGRKGFPAFLELKVEKPGINHVWVLCESTELVKVSTFDDDYTYLMRTKGLVRLEKALLHASSAQLTFSKSVLTAVIGFE